MEEIIIHTFSRDELEELIRLPNGENMLIDYILHIVENIPTSQEYELEYISPIKTVRITNVID